MRKYADIYGGIVRSIQSTNLDLNEFRAIWDPKTYWVDITEISPVEVGYTCRLDPQTGYVFEKPVELSAIDQLEKRREEIADILSKSFTATYENAYVMSSLGFEVNSNETAINNLYELILTTTDSIEFRDYNNITHTISLEDLKTIQKEIALNIINLRHQKWDIQAKIESASSIEELNSISFEYTMMSFING